MARIAQSGTVALMDLELPSAWSLVGCSGYPSVPDDRELVLEVRGDTDPDEIAREIGAAFGGTNP